MIALSNSPTTAAIAGSYVALRLHHTAVNKKYTVSQNSGKLRKQWIPGALSLPLAPQAPGYEVRHTRASTEQLHVVYMYMYIVHVYMYIALRAPKCSTYVVILRYM